MAGASNLYDVIVVGGGPAGLTAALYLARARYRVLVVEKEHFGGQITITSEVVNYPGVGKTSGKELTETMRKQAEAFGAEFLLAEVEGFDLAGDIRKVKTSRGELSCFGILIATGAHPRMVGFAGEAEFRGHGVAYCATCDGEFFTGKEVFVVGGGFAAAEEAVFLTKYAKHVTILVRSEDFSCAKATADEAKNHENITVLTNTVVEEVAGDTMLQSLRYRNRVTGEVREYQAEDGDTFGVFVFAGYEPATAIVQDVVDLDNKGYIITDRSQQTSVPGIYAAGDVCIKSLRQVVTAVGDGALAATELERYAASMQAKTGCKPEVKELAKANTGASAAGSASAAGTGAAGGSAAGAAGASDNALFTPDMIAQLQTVFGRMTDSLVLQLYLDDRNVSKELQGYMEALAEQTDKLKVEIASSGNAAGSAVAAGGSEMGDADAADAADTALTTVDKLPCVRVCKPDGTWTGLAFHGVPGGHEFTSFVLGLYNAAGPGQAIDEDVAGDIDAIDSPRHIRIMVSLTCTMCPELVTAAQRIAAANPLVTAEIYDLTHFPEMQKQYNVMSVPCMLIDDKPPTFGKKNIRQVVDLLK